MADPKLVRSRVVIAYKCDDGYQMETSFRNGEGLPASALLDSLEELARLTALFGFEAEAKQVFDEARGRVAELKASREDVSGEEGGAER